MTDEKEKKVGSARAKLEAFERQDKARSVQHRRMFIIGGFLFIVLIGTLIFEGMSDVTWFDTPKNSAALAQKGKWDELFERLADDAKLTIDGKAIDRGEFVSRIRAVGGAGAGVFATHPHAFGDTEEGHWLECWVVWSRGDLSKLEVIPLVTSWLVRIEQEKVDGKWRAVKVELRSSVSG